MMQARLGKLHLQHLPLLRKQSKGKESCSAAAYFSYYFEMYRTCSYAETFTLNIKPALGRLLKGDDQNHSNAFHSIFFA